ncbi:hypothetical protein GCM10009422_23400 [Brevundimonas kwangchunensis]|uniref:DUF1036 domain-containing protein n=1 Tax=Brevundimonas kwangchunensis TaxID=322163 RepID=A0ABP3S4V5_9CAUL
MSAQLVMAAALALSAPGAPEAAAVQSKPGVSNRPIVDLRVCNYSGRDATVAVSYVEVGGNRFMNRGWYDVANGDCENIVSTDNANFYFYADATDDSGRNWQGSHNLCVEYPGPYTFYSAGTECQSYQELRGFVPFTAQEGGIWTWTLDP